MSCFKNILRGNFGAEGYLTVRTINKYSWTANYDSVQAISGKSKGLLAAITLIPTDDAKFHPIH